MNTAAVAQWVVVGAIVAACVLRAMRQVMPGTSQRLQARLARMLDRPGRSARVRRAGHWLQPPAAKAGSCGSGSGCGSCGGCPSASRDEAQPVVLHRHPRG